ncbi:MAG: hypothetical protein U0736_08680 [Gemmataceae bacterium]
MVPEDRKRDGLLLRSRSAPTAPSTWLDLYVSAGRWIRPRWKTASPAQLAGLQAAITWSSRRPGCRAAIGRRRWSPLAARRPRRAAVRRADPRRRRGGQGGDRVPDDLAARGKAMLVVSSDLRELMEVCDRIAVLSAGRLVATFDRGGWSEEAITAAAFTGYLHSSPEPSCP